MNFYTDMKRIAYVLREDETEAPAGFRNAFERALEARAVVRGAIRAGITAQQAEQDVYAALEAAGFPRIDFNQPTDDPASTLDLAASREFEILARTDLGEKTFATPAVADGIMYLRTQSHLYSLGKTK